MNNNIKYTKLPTLSFGQALRQALVNWGNNHRRVRRSEYWWCTLACAVYLVLFFLGRILLEDHFQVNLSQAWLSWLQGILIIPPVGLWAIESCGRLHDVNRRDTWFGGMIYPLLLILIVASVWAAATHHRITDITENIYIWTAVVLLANISLVFFVCCLTFFLKDSDKEKNDYGPSPKYKSN